MKFVLLISCIMSLGISKSFSQFDLQYAGSARSFPHLAGDLSAEFGYNYLLWGAYATSPMFGMIRTSIQGSSSIVVSHYDMRVSFYPISIFAFGLGKNQLKSDYSEFKDFDCTQVRCQGTLTKNYTFAKMALGSGNIMGTFSYSIYLNSYSDSQNKNQNVAEYQYLLSVSPDSEKEIHRTYFAGYKMGSSILGFIENNVEFLKINKNYKLDALIYQTPLIKDNLKLTLGIGTLQTSDQKPGTVILLKVSHELLPSMVLF